MVSEKRMKKRPAAEMFVAKEILRQGRLKLNRHCPVRYFNIRVMLSK